jgi:hypothetical protein
MLMSVLNDTELQLCRQFDSPDLVGAIKEITSCRQATIQCLSDDHFVRLEACGHFYPDPPAARRGRRTLRSITQLREMTWKLVQEWPLLGSDLCDKLVEKIERANQEINQRMV